jgi:hypothetical protein
LPSPCILNGKVLILVSYYLESKTMSAQEQLGEGVGSIVPLPGLDILERLEGWMSEGFGGSLGAPLPGLIEMAPEVPQGLHLPPRHTPKEIGIWMAGKAVAAQAAERRLAQ